MPAAYILHETTQLERRAAAFNADARPLGLYIERFTDASRACLGQTYDGRITAVRASQGGAFAALSIGCEVFVRTTGTPPLAEGAAAKLTIEAEARRGKLARATLHQQTEPSVDRFTAWASRFGSDIDHRDVRPGNPDLMAVFDDALRMTATLPGGGTLRLSPTPALTAIDIDTAGRHDAGRPASRALKINLAAAQEIPRLLSLRRIGGLVVVDCVGPMNRDSGGKIQAALKANLDNARVLAPSPFGLVQIALSWQETPLADLLFTEHGAPTAETLAIDAMRLAEREAQLAPSAQILLDMPVGAYDWLRQTAPHIQSDIDAAYGARISIYQTEAIKPSVRRK